MKNILFIPIILALGGCSSAYESTYFINKIAEYNSKLPTESYLMDENLKDTELLIFNYKKYKEFSSELDSYLIEMKSTHNEQYRYISHSEILIELSEDINKSKALKAEFKTKVMNDFSTATGVYFSKYKKTPVDATACESFANNTSRLIGKYFKSSNHTHIERIDEAIDQYEDCKKGELKDKPRDDEKAISTNCIECMRIVNEDPNNKALVELKNKICSESILTTKKL